MTGQIVSFKGVTWTIIPKLSLLPILIWSNAVSWQMKFTLHCLVVCDMNCNTVENASSMEVYTAGSS